MDKKTIRSFYLSLIDNPEAEWTSEKNGDWTLYHCQINNIKIKLICNMNTIINND